MKVIRTRKWTIELKDNEDGSTTLTRTNDGFNALELLGLLSLSSMDIERQMEGKVKPNRVVRNLVVNNEDEIEKEDENLDLPAGK